MNDKVDILLTTYNTNIKYLKQQIESILNQTYTEFYLLISDDNSTSEEVKENLREYSLKDKRIILFFQDKNIGYIRNFEFLLKKSQSNYIMFCDHDDVWYKDKIQKSLEKLKNDNVDLVYVNAHQINMDGEIIHSSYFKYKNIPLINGKNHLAISRCIGIGCSQIFTIDVKNRMLPFSNNVIAHDWLASFLANEGKGISYIDEPLFGYRLHDKNVFGGRNLSQNLNLWKNENGISYESFLKYRQEKVIKKAYLDGANMCFDYLKISDDSQKKKFLNSLIKYYEKLLKSKYINLNFISYFKFLGGKNLLKKEIKEFAIFHFPIIAYIKYKKG